jgi:3-hydroxyacyl-CoA dehydrogenase
MAKKINKVVIIGAGMMGRGIGQKMALEGLMVELVDLNQEILDQSLKQISENLKLLVENQYLTQKDAEGVLPRMKISTDLRAAANSDFVLEAVPENLDLKKRLFKELDRICPSQTILATNTSTLRISQIASVTNKPDKVIGFHWVNPPYLIPLVELIRGEKTAPETLNICKDLLRRIKLVPAVCERDIPGFIINRIQKVLLNECLLLVERGIVSLEDIDYIVQLAIGARLALYGPLKINDLVGNKPQSLHGFEYMFKETGDPRFKPSELMKQKVAAGEWGIRTGKGWFDYSGKNFEQLALERDVALIKIFKFLKKEKFHP